MKRPDLKIKDGVTLKAAHFLPHMGRIVIAALDSAPITTDGNVWITEAYRQIRETLDFHELVAAFDFRCRNIEATDIEARELSGRLWASRMQERLGDDYDVIAHGVEDGFHIHAEFDPR